MGDGREIPAIDLDEKLKEAAVNLTEQRKVLAGLYDARVRLNAEIRSHEEAVNEATKATAEAQQRLDDSLFELRNLSEQVGPPEPAVLPTRSIN